MKKILLAAFALLASLAFTACNEQKQEQKATAEAPKTVTVMIYSEYIDPAMLEDFEKKTFTDSETGITLPYFVYLPEGYSDEEKYPNPEPQKHRRTVHGPALRPDKHLHHPLPLGHHGHSLPR